ncbi:TRAP-type C4-dicarboxylate transport system permease small subunit [Caldalkalibacillus uzonensis]|uniref:TRAP-type C4-dicarboxylate transport system permease small subunit n=1 Tax=Caldalkalibacillus uzonensis TaxID=353224 RepID=A0ABU0CQC2_9BACI|nr:DUF2627 domain-containing protein [Caldalkalibacillus uzonensis]MDQ0337710.1 TRAP-type C4-dicarboxylate transport system permease small subunit [Caldalkalibacillus uzonensis]
MKIQRLISVLILVIPGAIGVYGWTLMREAFFTNFTPEGFHWGMFMMGLVLFIFGVAFVGGFIFYRDKKRRYGRRFKDDLDE